MPSSSDLEAGDQFENQFFQLIDAIRTISYPAERQCALLGNYNAAWEIRYHLTGRAPAVLLSPLCYLDKSQRDSVTMLVTAVEGLPNDAIEPAGVSATTNAGCMAALAHPAWEPLRCLAAELLKLLEPLIKANHSHLWDSTRIVQ